MIRKILVSMLVVMSVFSTIVLGGENEEYYGKSVSFSSNENYNGTTVFNEMYVHEDGADYVFTVLYEGEDMDIVTHESREVIATSFFNPSIGDIVKEQTYEDNERITSDEDKIIYRIDKATLETVPESISILVNEEGTTLDNRFIVYIQDINAQLVNVPDVSELSYNPNDIKIESFAAAIEVDGDVLEDIYFSADYDGRARLMVPENKFGELVLSDVLTTTGAALSVDSVEIIGGDPNTCVTWDGMDISTSDVEGRSSRGLDIRINGTHDVFLEIFVYSGKYGVAEVLDPNGNPYTGKVDYMRMYSIEGAGDNSGSSDEYVYNGEMFVELEDDFLNLKYALMLVFPTESTDAWANSEVVDYTSALITAGESKLIDIGVIELQTPTLSVELLNSNDDVWQDAWLEYFVSPVGESYDIDSIYGVVTKQKNGYIYLAPFGNGFSDSIRMKAYELANSASYLPTDYSTFSIATDGSAILKSPGEKIIQIQGNLYMPDSVTPIPMDYWRDVVVLVDEVDEDGNYVTNGAYIRCENSPEFEVFGLKEGSRYRILLRLYNSIDLSIDDSIPLFFTYSEEDGLIVMDLTATIPVFKGLVYAGNELYEDVLPMELYDALGNLVVEDFSLTVDVDDEPKEGVIFIGGIPELQAGSYTMVFDDPRTTLEYTGMSIEVEFPINQELLDENGYYKIDLPTSKVKGNINLEDGDVDYNNIARVYVNVFNKNNQFITNGRVRNDGVFAVSGLEEGQYYAQAYVSSYSTLNGRYSSSDKVLFTVDDEDESPMINIPLNKVSTKGIVTNPDGEGLEGVWVKLWSNNQLIYSVATDDEGEFYLPDLETGDYWLKAYGAGTFLDSYPISVHLEKGSEHSFIEVTLNETPQISGKIIFVDGNMSEVSDTRVVLYDTEFNVVASSDLDELYAYAFSGIDEGSYIIQAYVGENNDSITSSNGLDVEIVEGEVSTLDIELFSPDVTGNVYFANGDPADGGWVIVYSDNVYITSAKVSIDGSFIVGGLDSSKVYQIFATYLDSSLGHSNFIEVSVSDYGELTLKEAADVCGIVTSGGQPIEGVKIHIFDQEKNAFTRVTTNVYGEFYVNSMNTEKYYLLVENEDEYTEVKVEYTGTPVMISPIEIGGGDNE